MWLAFDTITLYKNYHGIIQPITAIIIDIIIAIAGYAEKVVLSFLDNNQHYNCLVTKIP